MIRKLILLSGVVALGGCIFVASGMGWGVLRPVFHKQWINKYAGEYKFDPLWVMALIKNESSFVSRARSRRGAVGLMQLLPTTARDMSEDLHLGPVTPEMLQQPQVNLRLGFHYLSKLRQEFDEDQVALLAAYNAGPGVVRIWRDGRSQLAIEDIPYLETQQFVRRVQRTNRWLHRLQRVKNALQRTD
ncbi:MAG: lytic transglycosylase domain-containing protein [Elusimicrobia bacterium]|nr:lytic transglycosylase domain-containing protein [Elusimicrobiota bacterium]